MAAKSGISCCVIRLYGLQKMLRNDKENPHVLQVIRGVWRVLLSQQAFTFVNRGSLASKNKKAQQMLGFP
jgi:hypothetical protein|tara:strand:- start:88 stop:297 length:210 start_codon:yes stop_codon:yes gene_type:complete